MNKVYLTDRLTLKVLDKSDAEAVLDYYIRNQYFLDEWESAKGDPFYTVRYQEEQLEKETASINNGMLFKVWLFKKEDCKRIIGSVSFNNIVYGAFQSCHLGYKSDKDESNKGYVTEAVRKGIDILFNEFGLHRIEANIMPKNSRSLCVVRKLGFQYEGIAFRYLKINGKWEDHIHMVLLNE